MKAFIRLLEKGAQQVEDVLQDGRINDTENLLVAHGWPEFLIRRVEAAEGFRNGAHLQLGVFVLLIWGRVVVTFYYFNNKWQESVDENISAVVIVAPLLEQVDQLLA